MTVFARICLSTVVLTAFVGILLFKNGFVIGSSDCSEYEFSCENGECIDVVLWCDTLEDCSDGSDEKFCKRSSLSNFDPNKCPSTYFRCNDGPCIPLSGRCDGYENCEDLSDEENCEIYVTPSKGGHISLFFKPVTPSLKWTTHATTDQMTAKLGTSAKHLPGFADTKQSSFRIFYSELQTSDYFRQRENAVNWLISHRRNDFGWGEETPRVLTALYLSAVQRPFVKNESDLLMIKQLEVQLFLDLARNESKVMELTHFALYINAVLASCNNPKNFHGDNLVDILRNSVNAAEREAVFVNPSVYLTLCNSNATTNNDMTKLLDMFSSENMAMKRTDIQSLAFLAITCIFRNTNYLVASTYESLKTQFLSKINISGLPGNVYEASLLAQALQELNVTQPRLLEFILKQQLEDGSFGGILATYIVLPVLAGRSFLQISGHCNQRYTSDIAPIEVLQNPKRKKIYVQYSLNYGYPPEITQTIKMKVTEGINFIDLMRLAQEVNPKFRFMLNDNHEIPVVYSIGEIPNDAEKGTFWTLYLGSSTNGSEGSLSPFSGNIKQLTLNPGDKYVFWMRSI